MNLSDIIEKRHSIRQYNPRAVSDEIIGEIIKLSSLAPSAGNMQSYKVVVSRKKLVNINSPVQLVICADMTANRYGRRGEFYSIQNATILAAYIQLVALDKGLATVWIGAFNEGAIREKLSLPEHLRPIAIIPMGYSNVVKGRGKRKQLKDILITTDKR